MGSSLAIVSFGRKNLSRFKEGGREGKSFDSNAIEERKTRSRGGHATDGRWT